MIKNITSIMFALLLSFLIFIIMNNRNNIIINN